ncbi:MAK10-like protein [Tanacetum coccineum]
MSTTKGDENPIRTLGDYSRPSHEGYRNTIELPERNNVVPSDTIRLVQNGCSFHGLRSEDLNQHLKDFLKLASNWLERLPARSISTWEDLTIRFLSQFFPSGRTTKLRNDILMFQQHHGESLSEAWTRFKRTIDQSVGGNLRDLNPEESWAILEDLALYDNESWNDPRDFAKPVKAIALPQDVPSLSPQPQALNITFKARVRDYMAAHTERMGRFENAILKQREEINEGLVSEFMASQDARLSRFEADFKQQQNEMTNKIDTVLKAITNQIAGTLPSDTVKNPKLGTHPVSSARSYLISDPQYSSQPSTSINTIKAHLNDTITMPQQPEEPKPTLEDEFKDLHLNLPVLVVLAHDPIYNAILDKYVERESEPFDALADLGSCVNIIPLYLFKKLNIGLLEETDHIFGLADGTKSYPVGIVKDVEVHIGKLKLLNDFYVLDMKKDPETPLLVGRGFLATANSVIDCRMTKIAVGEGITRSVFGVKGVDLGAKPPYYASKDFLDYHLPRKWEISRDAELNPFKDTLVFRRMVIFDEKKLGDS